MSLHLMEIKEHFHETAVNFENGAGFADQTF